jgi:hypothetical protein
MHLNRRTADPPQEELQVVKKPCIADEDVQAANALGVAATRVALSLVTMLRLVITQSCDLSPEQPCHDRAEEVLGDRRGKAFAKGLPRSYRATKADYKVCRLLQRETSTVATTAQATPTAPAANMGPTSASHTRNATKAMKSISRARDRSRMRGDLGPPAIGGGTRKVAVESGTPFADTGTHRRLVAALAGGGSGDCCGGICGGGACPIDEPRSKAGRPSPTSRAASRTRSSATSRSNRRLSASAVIALYWARSPACRWTTCRSSRMTALTRFCSSPASDETSKS